MVPKGGDLRPSEVRPPQEPPVDTVVRHLRLTIIGLCVALVASLTSATTAAAQADQGSELENQIEAVILAEHNEARAANGLPPLSPLAEIDPIAEAHSRAMAGADNLYHSDLSRLITDFPAHWWAGENVLVTYGAAGTATQLWLDSPGHRANLLATNATHVGIAVHCGNDGRLWATVQLVENRQAPADAPTIVPTEAARQLTCRSNALSTIGDSIWAPFPSAEAFVTQQYRDFLGREPDAAGLTFWSNVLEQRMASPTALVESFLNSAEFGDRIATVNRLYLAAFDRNPTAAELDYWSDQMARGRSAAWVAAFFADSPEFTATYGALDSEGFVDRLYRNVLDRGPDGAGLDFWAGRIDRGQARGDVLLAFATSHEFEQSTDADILVRMIYLGLLGRSPDPGGLAFWSDRARSGQPLADLISGFLASNEYADRIG